MSLWVVSPHTSLFERHHPQPAYALLGHSVFYKNAKGEIFHTYGTFGRGSELFMGIYGYFDVLSKTARNMDRITCFRTGRRFITSMRATTSTRRRAYACRIDAASPCEGPSCDVRDD
jgi:hypothetical protein